MRFDIATQATPDQVRRAMTDFTDQRLRTWSRTLDPSTYELRELGDTWAVARESTARSPHWVVCRYDWSDPTVVRWTVEECSWGGSGEGSVRATPEDGGSRVDVEWTYTGATRVLDKVGLALIPRFPIRTFIMRQWKRALDEFAQAERG